MQRTTIIEQLQGYIAQDILAGKDIGLDETTPLLEWGIINSLRLINSFLNILPLFPLLLALLWNGCPFNPRSERL